MEAAGTKLPEEFVRRMQIMLGDEYEAFAAFYDTPRRSGLRVNILRNNLRSGGNQHRITHHQRGDVLTVMLTFGKNHRKGGVRAHVITLLQTDGFGFAGLVATGGKCCNAQRKEEK